MRSWFQIGAHLTIATSAADDEDGKEECLTIPAHPGCRCPHPGGGGATGSRVVRSRVVPVGVS